MLTSGIPPLKILKMVRNRKALWGEEEEEEEEEGEGEEEEGGQEGGEKAQAQEK